ncbi:hypothetical protein Sango_0181900 [Sesamum angolense]|uniref:Uncharacterized protein n=1 Tax=Sesamum angolense TaxID=2727404 RepID=A0AAE1XGP9_9LAMI|nr:hypothetical protein Sango_0181900 [Sesamum angolense]
MALLSSSVSANPLSLCISTPHSSRSARRKVSPSLASLSTPSSSSSASHESTSATKTEIFGVSTKGSSPRAPFVEPLNPPELPYNYALANPSESPVVQFVQATESTIERVIFDFRFLALLAVGGSLAGSVLCFLNGCVYIFEAYKVYWTSCVKGIHTGNMVLRLVEAIDVYLAGTVMLIFGMGLYGLFISNVTPDVPPSTDRALKGSSLFGMFALKMFERSKMVTITTGTDLLSYSVCIFLSSASCTFFTTYISRKQKSTNENWHCQTVHSYLRLHSQAMPFSVYHSQVEKETDICTLLFNFFVWDAAVSFPHQSPVTKFKKHSKSWETQVRLPGVEPGSIAWKAIILAVGLQTLDVVQGRIALRTLASTTSSDKSYQPFLFSLHVKNEISAQLVLKA